MTVTRVHVYTAVCTCHAHTTRPIGDTWKYDDNTYTPSEDTPWYAAIPNCCACFTTHMMTTIWWCANTYTASDATTPVRWHTRIVAYTFVPVRPTNMQTMYPQFPRIWHVRTHMWSRKKVSVISVRWPVICCQEWGCTQLLVGKLGHTGLVTFVAEPSTVCWEVPLEYGFEVLIGSEQQWRRSRTKFGNFCPRSIAGVQFDWVRRFRASSLLHTTCKHLCFNWVASCVAA